MGAGREVNENVALGVVPSSEVSRLVIAAAEQAGYDVGASGPAQYQLSRQYRPEWVVPVAVVVGLLTLGVGLLLLLVVKRVTEVCTVRVVEATRGTELRVTGIASPELLTALRAAVPGGSATPASTRPVAPTGGSPAVHPDETESTARADPAPIAAVPGVSSFAPQPGPESPGLAGAATSRPDATIARASLGSTVPTVADRSIEFGRQRHSLEHPIVIGRDPAAPPELPSAVAVRLPDRSISKTHCAIRAAGDGAEVRDLASTNGTSVERNGSVSPCAPGSWTPVSPGDVVIVGDQRGRIA